MRTISDMKKNSLFYIHPDSKQLLLKVLENQGDILKRVKKIEKALEGKEKGAAKCEEKTTVPLGLRVIIYECINFTSFFYTIHVSSFLFNYCVDSSI